MPNDKQEARKEARRRYYERHRDRINAHRRAVYAAGREALKHAEYGKDVNDNGKR